MTDNPINMRYEWEDDAKSEVFAECGDYEVIGVAVANHETGEACFIDMSDMYGGVLRADLLKDVEGDVSYAYGDSLEKMRAEYEALRKKAQGNK